MKANRDAHLVAAATGSFDLPPGGGTGNGTGGTKGLKGTVASAGFGNGVATGGNGDGRSNGRGSGIATGAFGQQELSHGGPKIQPDSGPANQSRLKSLLNRIRFIPTKPASSSWREKFCSKSCLGPTDSCT